MSEARSPESTRALPPSAIALWRWLRRHWRRMAIFAPAVAFLLFSVLYLASASYKSDGFLRASRKLAEYNAQRAAFADKSALQRFLLSEKLEADANGSYLTHSLQENFLRKHVTPVLPYSKAELGYLNNTKTPLDPDILGFNISLAAASPADAAARVEILGDFLKDTMLRQELTEIVHTKAAEFKSRKQQIDNQIIAKRIELRQETERLKSLKVIAGRYPGADRLASRQLLSSDAASSKYLSPVAQLVGAESAIADLRMQLTSLERDAAQNALRETFFARAEALATPPRSGKAMLAGYLALQKDVFDGTDLKDDDIREVFNDVGLIAEELRTRHLVNAHFASGPTLPDRRAGPGMPAMAVFSLLGGCVIVAMVLFGLDFVRRANGKDAALAPAIG
ncbi:hypothetical protein [Cupriavidus sp. WS]|uniref:hypothetical protein n=1 Tax=Cupriavidus sp. WS TaxID=1312922 RepID=UPI0018CB136D|nr:hypothetical protein [Cupriavidus sp. WS]